jgi:hypothetical protein
MAVATIQVPAGRETPVEVGQKLKSGKQAYFSGLHFVLDSKTQRAGYQFGEDGILDQTTIPTYKRLRVSNTTSWSPASNADRDLIAAPMLQTFVDLTSSIASLEAVSGKDGKTEEAEAAKQMARISTTGQAATRLAYGHILSNQNMARGTKYQIAGMNMTIKAMKQLLPVVSAIAGMQEVAEPAGKDWLATFPGV